MITLVIVLLFSSLRQILGTQCPSERNTNLLRKVTYYDSTDPSLNSVIYDIEYDSPSGEFFYLGEIYNEYFVSRTDTNTNNIWIQVFTDPVVYFSLAYSPIHETIYYTLRASNYTLIRLNSTDGNYLTSIKITEATQFPANSLSCSLSSDESALFCNGRSNRNYQPCIIRYDVLKTDFYVASYPKLDVPGVHLEAISNTEVFYHIANYDDFHFIKSNFTDAGVVVEQYHQVMTNPSSSNRGVVKIDESDQTIWHAVANNDIIYFQHNLSDFSLIGSRYATAGNYTPAYVYGMSMNTNFVFIQCYLGRNLLIKIDKKASGKTRFRVIDHIFHSVTIFIINCHIKASFNRYLNLGRLPAQSIISLTSSSASHNPYSLIADDEHLNLVVTQYNSTASASYAVHYQIPLILEMSSRPIYQYDRALDYTFIDISNPSFDMINQTLDQHSVTLGTKSNYQPQLLTSSYTFSIVDSENYILSLSESMTHNITLNIGQNHTENIVLPCSIDTFDTLTYANHDNGVDPIPSWITPDYVQSTLDIRVPEDIQPSNHTYMVETTYSDGSVINNFYISVVECNFSNCISCRSGLCTACVNEYELSSDYLSCNLPAAINETENQTENQPSINFDRNSTTATKTIQAVAGIGIFIGFTNSAISGSSAQGAWTMVNLLQLLLLLPLMANFMSQKVVNFILCNGFSTFSFNFIPIKEVDSMGFIEKFDFEQPNNYIDELGMESGSALVNYISSFLLLFLLLVLHFIVFCIYQCCKKKKNCFQNLISKLFNFFTFTVYLRFIVESFTFSILVSTFEIKYYIEEGKGNKASIIASMIILTLLIIFILVALISWLVNFNTTKIHTQFYTSELYNGIRECQYKNVVQDNENRVDENQADRVPIKIKLARLYTFIFLIRRLLIIAIIILMDRFSYKPKISSLAILQVAYLVFVIIIRIFDNCSDQICEIVNELIYSTAMISLAYLTTQQKWTQTVESAYIGAILMNTVILLVVSFSVSIINFIRLVKKCRKKCQKKPRIEPNRIRVNQRSTFAVNNISTITQFRFAPERDIKPTPSKLVALSAYFLYFLYIAF